MGIYVVEDRTPRISACINEIIITLELISHCEKCNDEAISGLTNESRDCHSPAGFAVTYFEYVLAVTTKL
ncbi:hypothetical protein [Denitrovibrio acetiphilus]|uniref:hypothetical protein n=1 Tax=Denitrovibrio acetiphilus TaxID=118000 RepID=UPI0011D049B6|nr:hypothetical protein [Denitrovibrio acetiphilus]